MALNLDEYRSRMACGPAQGIAGVENHIIVADCLEVLELLPDDCVDLIHTSPPYNIDRPYKGQKRDLHPLEAYLEFLQAVIVQLKRIVKPNGSIFWQTGYTQFQNGIQGDILPIDMVSYGLFHEEPIPLVLWDRIIWRYFGGMAFKRKFTNRHETILWYVRPTSGGTAAPYFDVDKIRERTRELDKRNNFWGRNPGNVWEVDRVAFGSTQQSSHIAVYPEEVTERIIRACSPPDALILDPFSGSGTTLKVARGLGRRWIGVEIVEDYAVESEVRLGYQQANEPASLASGIIKTEIFAGRRGTLSIETVANQLSWWLQAIDLSGLRHRFDAIVDEALHDESPSKLRKRQGWETLDSWIESRSPKDPVVLADGLLLEDYKLRHAWNGALRYRTALRRLESLVASFSNCVDPSQYVVSIIENEPSSFRLHQGVIELKEPRRRLKEHALETYGSRTAPAEPIPALQVAEAKMYQPKMPL